MDHRFRSAWRSLRVWWNVSLGLLSLVASPWRALPFPAAGSAPGHSHGAASVVTMVSMARSSRASFTVDGRSRAAADFFRVFRMAVLDYFPFNLTSTGWSCWPSKGGITSSSRGSASSGPRPWPLSCSARSRTLRMQINPHFLFNTPQHHLRLVHEKRRPADRMIARLSELLAARWTTATPRGAAGARRSPSSRATSRLSNALPTPPSPRHRAKTQELLVPQLILQPSSRRLRHGILPARSRAGSRSAPA